MRPITRREFGALIAAGVVGGGFTTTAGASRRLEIDLPASEIIDRIRRNIGVEWRENSVDTVKAGDPSTTVTGIVTTSLASIDVLRQAAALGANFVITSEPTFYRRADTRTPAAPGGPGGGGAPQGAPPPPPPPDPMFDAKNQFIDANRIVVMRLSDHWRARQPDGFAEGFADTLLGAGTFPSASGSTHYDIPTTRLDEFASDVKRRLGSRGGIRVIGDPSILVRKVGLLPGTIPIATSLEVLPAVDVLVAGEIREWESSEYARDVVYSGQPKGMILVGRIVSEDPGMRSCAHWLESIVPELPVRHLSAGDPYWRPVS